MSFFDTIDRQDLLGSWGGAGGQAADVVLAMVASAGAVFLGSPRGFTWSDVVDLRVVARFLVVFVTLLLGLVAYHRIVERRAVARVGRIARRCLAGGWMRSTVVD